jgi:hypothetical protein
MIVGIAMRNEALRLLIQESCAGYCVKLYGNNAGVPPSHGEDSVGAAVLLCTVTNNAQSEVGLNWGDPADGAISKDTGEVWRGVFLAGGTVGFARFCALNDDNTADPTASKKRLQLSFGVAPDKDIVTGSSTFSLGDSFSIDFATLSIPEGSM